MQQLELFAQPTSTPQYKAGDWVKTKRKPAIAAHIKRGEIFEVNAVHPNNGSMRFWNPYINQWDFLYSEEVKLTVEPVVGEIPKLTVESVVGEVKTPKNYWNCDEGYSGNGWLESHYKIRVNDKQRSIKYPEIGCTGPYYSYRWMDGKRQRAKYTPASKCPAVVKALRLGETVNEILKIISNQ